MTLQDKLDAFKVDFETNQAPAAAVEAFHRSNQELIDSGQAERALKAGDIAPDFKLEDTDGNIVSSRELLAKGPVVLTFYRGIWCPYCNMELEALEEVVGDIEARGATLVAISQQSRENNKNSKNKNSLSYSVLSDKGGDLGEEFGLRWTLPEYLIEIFKMFKVDLPVFHKDDKWTLPMPARYVIEQDGTIAYAEVNPDYTRRPEPSDLFPVLDKVTRKAAA